MSFLTSIDAIRYSLSKKVLTEKNGKLKSSQSWFPSAHSFLSSVNQKLFASKSISMQNLEFALKSANNELKNNSFREKLTSTDILLAVHELEKIKNDQTLGVKAYLNPNNPKSKQDRQRIVELEKNLAAISGEFEEIKALVTQPIPMISEKIKDKITSIKFDKPSLLPEAIRLKLANLNKIKAAKVNIPDAKPSKNVADEADKAPAKFLEMAPLEQINDNSTTCSEDPQWEDFEVVPDAPAAALLEKLVSEEFAGKLEKASKNTNALSGLAPWEILRSGLILAGLAQFDQQAGVFKSKDNNDQIKICENCLGKTWYMDISNGEQSIRIFDFTNYQDSVKFLLDSPEFKDFPGLTIAFTGAMAAEQRVTYSKRIDHAMLIVKAGDQLLALDPKSDFGRFFSSPHPVPDLSEKIPTAALNLQSFHTEDCIRHTSTIVLFLTDYYLRKPFTIKNQDDINPLLQLLKTELKDGGFIYSESNSIALANYLLDQWKLINPMRASDPSNVTKNDDVIAVDDELKSKEIILPSEISQLKKDIDTGDNNSRAIVASPDHTQAVEELDSSIQFIEEDHVEPVRPKRNVKSSGIWGWIKGN